MSQMSVMIQFDPNDPVQVQRGIELLAAISGAEALVSDEQFDLLWNKIGKGAASFVQAAAKHTSPGQSFTFESLATSTGETVRTLKAKHRNLSRTLKALGAKAPVLFAEKWDGQRQHYTLTDGARAAIAV